MEFQHDSSNIPKRLSELPEPIFQLLLDSFEDQPDIEVTLPTLPCQPDSSDEQVTLAI